MNDKTAQIIAGLLQLLGALPLAVYPFVLLANLMSAAAKPEPDTPPLLLAVTRTFLVGTTAYPVVFLLCLFGARRALGRGDWERGLTLSSLPLLEVAALYGLMTLWQRLEKNSK